MSEHVARFHMRRAEADREGYYVTRWDKAVDMTVLGANQKEAINKADAFSGEAQRGKYWTFIVDRIEEVTVAEPEPAS